MIPIAARRKVMLAAGEVDTHSCREAAILGGIVRCAIGCGRYDARVIQVYTHDIIKAFNLVGVDATPPNRQEISGVLDRFQDAYGRPLAS